MEHKDTLYLIGRFQLHATLEPALHQVRVKTPVSRVKAFLCFIVTRVRICLG